MPFQILLAAKLFGVSKKERIYTERYILHILEGITRANVDYLALYPATPPLFKSGIVYVREPPGREHWQDIPTSMERREADCEDLASHHAAEIRADRCPIYPKGTRARCFLRWREYDGRYLYHCLVQVTLPTGKRILVDPSRRLGMTGKE
jgi:hypothetical protein